jgi:methyl-accepting chemotaxis protein
MSILGNLRIRTVSLLGTLFLAVTAIGSAGMAIMATETLGGRINYVADETVPTLGALARLRGQIGDMRLVLLRHVLTTDPVKLVDIDRDLVASFARTRQKIDDYRKFRRNAQGDEAQAIDALDEAYRNWLKQAQIVRSLSLENRNEEAFAAFNNQVYGRGQEMGSRINDLLNSNTKTADATMNAARRQADHLRVLAMLVAGVAGLAGLAVVLMFRARMSRPLATLVEAMDDMAGGSSTVPCRAVTRPMKWARSPARSKRSRRAWPPVPKRPGRSAWPCSSRSSARWAQALPPCAKGA